MTTAIVLPGLSDADSDLLESIKTYAKTLRNENTRKATQNVLRDFYSFKSFYSIPIDACKSRCEDYLDYLLGQNRKTATIQQKFYILSSFFEHLRDDGLISKNPVRQMKLPEITDQENTKARSPEDVKTLLRGAPKENLGDLAHYVSYELMFRIGCRVGDLKTLKWSDLIQDMHKDYRLEFIQKRGKKRKVGIPKFLANMLLDYKEIFERDTGLTLNKSDYVFQFSYLKTKEKQSKPFDTSAYNRKLKRLAKTLGIEGNISAHQARATFITEGLDIGRTARDIAMTAGCSIVNVERYDNQNEDIQREVISGHRY